MIVSGILFCSTVSVIGQQNIKQIDSLNAVLEETSDLLESAILKNELAGKYIHTKPNEAIQLGEEASPILEKENHELLAELYLKLYYAHGVRGTQETALKYLAKAKKIAARPSDLADIYNIMGSIHFGGDSMDYYVSKYFEIVQKENVIGHVPNSYQQVGMVAALAGNVPLADSLWSIGVEKCNRTEFSHNKTSLLYNLAVLYMPSANYDLVANYAQRGLALADKDSLASDQIGFLNILAKVSLYNADSIATVNYWEEAYNIIESRSFYSNTAGDIMNELGLYRFSKGQYSEATKLAEKLVEIGQIRQDVIDQARGYNLLGRVASVGGVRDQAISNFRLSLADTAKITYLPIQNDLLLTVAEGYWKMGDAEVPMTLINQIERNLNKTYDLKMDRNFTKFKYKFYQGLGRHKSALIEFEKFKELYDKFLLQTNSEKLLKAKAEFETDRKQLQLDKSRAENQVLEQKNKARKNQLILGTLGLLVLFTLIYLGRSLKFAKTKEKLQSTFAQNLLASRETERKRIARDLHDGPGQNLILLKQQLVNSDQQNMVGSTLEEIRTISRGLHPFVLEKFGLTAAIENLISKTDETTDIFITSEIVQANELIKSDQQIHVYRIIQECLNNAIKYSESPSVNISIKKHDEYLVVMIQDHGKGFDAKQALNSKSSLGMHTMYERAAILNANIDIISEPSKGTTVNVHIPISK